ncbi:carotenoid 9,10(9',10')-cleavage dioxygenase 1 isoform X1 [Lactuca sativa]|uniref:carotenoid 9,10(9',10')-cleavage dioxygenase 1 isoform X1 n=2 Tax=Lactuca sativa TaxID=4236 RepID=UPI000CB5BF34|nr:carotenoid 9,10(9',10')-cleavage dioxygenase 1 isoform X1 [Lactuca sativa]
MATATCVLSSIKCSTNNHPRSVKVGDLKTALSSIVMPSLQRLEKSTLKTEVGEAIKNGSLAMLNTLVDSIFQFVDQPMLSSQKNFAPVEEIGELVKIDYCQGEIPEDFPEGVYIRNGSNPLFGGLKSTISVFGKTDNVWVEGEGMLHVLHFTKDTDRIWSFYYKNRYVETDTYKMESKRKKPAFIPVAEGDAPATLAGSFFNAMRFGQANKIYSNTNVFEHGGKHYSIAENYMPQEINLISLETYGNWNPSGVWSRPFTSHPKKAPETGELVVVGIDTTEPHCVVGVISADGKELVHKLDLQLDHCSLFHDIGVTKKYTILIDFMLTMRPERVMKGGQLFKYEREKDARIAVIPRYGEVDSIMWFHIQPCVTYHLINCFEDGDEVVVRGCTANTTIIPGPVWGEDKLEWFSRGFNFKNVASASNNDNDHKTTGDGMLFTSVREWRLNLKTLEVMEKDVTGTEYSMDFPIINEHFTGLEHKYGYTQVIDSLASSNSGKSKYGGLAKLYFEETDSEGNVKMEYHWLPKNNFCTGSTFVAKTKAVEEDDGWVVTFAHDEDSDTSYVLVVDANNFGNEPIAIINLPQRVPYGHHGSFFLST